MEMEVEVQIYHYDFRKAIFLARVDPLVHGAPTQCESFAVQRDDPRSMSIMINKRKYRSTCKNIQTRSSVSKIYTTNQPSAKCPAAKKKMGTYFTANPVGVESIEMSAIGLNPKLPHRPETLPHLEGKAYGYRRCCYLCR